jgi:hypothetical protein
MKHIFWFVCAVVVAFIAFDLVHKRSSEPRRRVDVFGDVKF